MPKLAIQSNVNQPLCVGGLVGVLNPTQVKLIEATVQELEAIRIPLSLLVRKGLITISAVSTTEDPFDDHAEGVVFSQLPSITGDPSANYVTTSSSSLLPNEKVLTAGNFITITPAVSTVTVSLASHASTHTSVGTDPLNTSTITATNNTLTLTGWYTLNSTEADNIVIGTISQTVASVTASMQPGVPRTINVSFPPSWVGGTITVNGIGRNGASISEVYTTPGVGGGVHTGLKPFFTLTNFVNSNPTGSVLNANIVLGQAYGVPHFPIVSFLKVSIDGSATTFDIMDTTNGTFDPVGTHHGNHGIDVWYTYTVSITQSSHNHNII